MAETNSQPTAGDDLQAKLEEARRALEGEEHAAKREQTEKTKAVKSEREELEKHLADLLIEKEKLELAWIDLDAKRKVVHEALKPILEEEKQAEEAESKLEVEEARIGVETEKHKVELDRQAIQAKRKEIETRKWAEEEKLIEVEKKIETNTAQYRILLDDEDKSTLRLEQLKAETI
jgi:hypothetical protein